ncbi:tetratricopeptide repeat protein, partial [Planktothrix sp.]|uniref:tetratricopeptide repeat protein n=1 Tax=Planktothrix sp. TaxID=3088171 RepID=UPI0038D3C991
PTPLVEDLQIKVKSLETLIQVSDLLKETAKSNYSSCDTKPMMFSSNLNVMALENGLKKAKEHLTQKNFEEAILACKKVLNLDKNCAEAYTILGNVLQLQGNFEQAQASYEKAIELQPDLPEPLGNLGSLYAKQQQWELGVEFYQKALKYKPDCEKLYRNLAKVLTKLNRTEEATECWYHAYRLQPDLVKAQEQFDLGKTLLSQGKIEFGIACFRQALKQEPNWKEAQAALKTAQQQATQSKKIALSKTKPCRDVVCNVSTGNETEILKQAEQDLNDQLFKKAIAQCQQVIAQSPNQGKAYEILAKAFNQLGRLDLAIKAYRKLVKLQPQNAIFYTNLGNLYAKRQEWQSAIIAYQNAITLNPNLAIAYHRLGQIFQQLGNQDQAIDYWYQGFNIEPTAFSATDHLALGHLLWKKGLLQPAATCYRYALECDPTNATAYHNLGEVLAAQGQLEAAIDAYHHAIKLNSSFETYNSLGKALRQQGRWQEVIACYRRAMELNPRLLMAMQTLTLGLAYSQTHQDQAESQPLFSRIVSEVLSWQPQIGGTQPRPQLRGIEPETSISVSYTTIFPDVTLQQVQKLFEQGKYQQCMRQCQQLVKAIPQESRVYLLWGKAAFALGEQEVARKCYHKAVRLEPEKQEGYCCLGELYITQQNWKGAISAYQKAIQVQPTSEAYRRLSQVWQALGQPENAQDCLYEVFQLEPQLGTVTDYLQLGDNFWEREQKTQAMICYGRALALDPQQTKQHPHWVERLQILNTETAEKTITNGYLKNGGILHPLLQEATENLKLGEWDACIRICTRLIEQEPNHADAYHLLAKAWQAQGQVESAKQAYQKALQLLQPQDPELNAWLGDLYAEQENWQEALDCYQAAVQLDSNFISVYEALADILFNQGQYSQAITYYQKVLEFEPNLWEIYQKLGDTLRQQGDQNSASMAYQRATELSQSLTAITDL